MPRALPGDTPAPARHSATVPPPAPTHVSADRPRGWFRNQRTLVRRVETPSKIGGYRDSLKTNHRSPQMWRRKSLKKFPNWPAYDPNWRHSARPDSALSECPSGSLRMPLGLGLVPGTSDLRPLEARSTWPQAVPICPLLSLDQHETPSEPRCQRQPSGIHGTWHTAMGQGQGSGRLAWLKGQWLTRSAHARASAPAARKRTRPGRRLRRRPWSMVHDP